MKMQNFESHVSEVADYWFSRASRLAMSGLCPPFYLYYIPGEGLRLVAENLDIPDPTWELGSTEPIRCSSTRDQARRLIHAAARRLPILSD
jgi:hypothetical protein